MKNDRVLDIELEGRSRRIVLQTPSTGELAPLLLELFEREPHAIARVMPLELFRWIKTIDGDPIDLSHGRAIWSDAQAAAAVLAVRNEVLHELRAAAKFYARCPHCRRWEAEQNVLAMMIGLEAPLPPLVDREVFLIPPALSRARPRAARSSAIARADQLRIGDRTLLDLESVEGRAREAEAWRKHEADADRGASYRVRDRPGFRAVLRAAVILAEEPKSIEAMPYPELVALDAINWLTHHVSVGTGSAIELSCEDCGCLFVPVR